MSRRWARVLARGVALAAVSGLAACGGTNTAGVVRVGATTITAAALKHRVAVETVGHRGSSGQAIRRQALEYLLVARWLAGEAAEEGRRVTAQEVKARLKERREAEYPGGEAEFAEFLKQSGQSVEDAAEEVESELAVERLRQAALDSAPAITEAEIRSDYARERSHLGTPEQREVWFRAVKTRADAEQYMRKLGSGVEIAPISEVEKATGARGPNAIKPADVLERAIDDARPHEIIGPFKYNADWFALELKKVTPPVYETFTQARALLKQQLTEAARQRALTEFEKAWVHRWRARTDCNAGYVVAACMQYKGPAKPEDPLTGATTQAR